MQTYFDCLACLTRHTIDVLKLYTDDTQVQEKVIRQSLALLSTMDLQTTPPRMAQLIHQLIRREMGPCDPYMEIKQRFNTFILSLYPRLKLHIEQSNHPLATALQLAIAGNIIDFGVHRDVSIAQVEQTIDQALATPLSSQLIAQFEQEVRQASTILYLCDNAGEVVFDRMLIEQLPAEKVVAAVRGQAILNDALLEDARQAGLTDLVRVVDNGSDAPGTILETCSPQFVELFEKADLIISKGQGNFETLNAHPHNIFFLLKAKCPIVARELDVELGTHVFMRNPNFKEPNP